MGRQGAAVIDAPDNVGVADINDDEHGTYCTFRAGGLASRLREKLWWFVWSIWSVWSIWLNQTNQIDQINQMHQTDRACPRFSRE
jgi:hypothetical protein